MEPDNDDFHGDGADDLVDFQGEGEDDEMFNGGEEDLGDDLHGDDEFEADGATYQAAAPGESSAYIPRDAPNATNGEQPNAASNVAQAQEEAEQSAPLIEFNKKFRQQVEEKDKKEREAKQQRRKAASNQLSSWLENRVSQLDKRKEQNRIEQEETQNEIMAAMDDSWKRVVSLIDAQNPEAGGYDVSRMKDVLVQLKNEPLPEDGAAH
eukprot:gb/GECG01001402.1/.p1 GENE.gb/GECG01001402.1/~~gb/GECG01001402.1/.p1  ORF type:complete len:209 (+),score=60.24 gb/GECG01001402.1/:1-627(+)